MTAEATNTADTNLNEEVVLRFMRLVDSHDYDALNDVLASDIQFHFGADSLNRKQAEGTIRMFYTAFPDLTHTVEEVLAVGDRVVLRATDRATHGGVFQGMTPTGRRILVSQIAIYRMADGKIAEIWEEADVFGLMKQLGAVPAP